MQITNGEHRVFELSKTYTISKILKITIHEMFSINESNGKDDITIRSTLVKCHVIVGYLKNDLVLIFTVRI